MRKTGTRILAICFIIIIFLFGGATLLKAKGSILKTLRKEPVTAVPASVEDILTEKFKSRNTWININGLFQRLIGVTVIRDAGDIDVFKMSNGQLTYEYPDCDMTYAAEAVTGLKDFAQDRGMSFIYVQLPCKAYTDDLMPQGTHTYGYADSDEIISTLRDNNVEVLDLRENISDENKDIPSLFFNTDHHWKPSTALWAAGIISDRRSDIDSGYSYDASIYDPDNYKRSEYDGIFLGSLGKRTGKYFGGVDDFEVLEPEFDTAFELYTESQTDGTPKHRGGDFTKTFLKLKKLKDPDLFNGMVYFTYMGTEYRLARSTNLNRPNSKKVLMLRDSFSCTLLPYMALSAGEITAIDLRYHKDLNLKEYIEDNDFDIVMVAYNPSMFREEGAFDFDR